MTARIKPSPTGAPPAPQAARQADSGGPRVSMTIDGGPRGEEYRFHFEASAGGAVAFRLKSELAGRQVDDSTGRMAAADFDRLLRSIDVRRLKDAQRTRMPSIPPCSVVGQLEVFDGRERVQVVFMADPDQASQAGYRMPPAVARATERIYALAAEQLGLKGAAAIRPGGR